MGHDRRATCTFCFDTSLTNPKAIDNVIAKWAIKIGATRRIREAKQEISACFPDTETVLNDLSGAEGLIAFTTVAGKRVGS
jgi:hypothetical protein